MSREWEDQIEQMQADGRITVHDADEVRNFASFLDAVPKQPLDTPEKRKQFRESYQQHYPEDYARAVAEHRRTTTEQPDDTHDTQEDR